MTADLNQNRIPDKVDIVASLVAIAVIAGLTVWGSLHPAVWVVVAVTALSYLVTVFRVGLLSMPPAWNSAAVTVLGTTTTVLAALQLTIPASTTWFLIAQGVVGALAGAVGMGAKALPGKA
jgi:hypothetical protein